LRELREQGITDYLAFPMTFSSGRHQAVTFLTDRRGGFEEAETNHLAGIMPVLSLVLAVHADRLVTAALLSAYLGPKAGTQVLAGKVRRGGGERIEAVVLVADMRGFSELSDRQDSEYVLATLSQFLTLSLHAPTPSAARC
jgi:adenylate cyclase